MDKQDMELANKLNSDLTMAIESGSAMAGKLRNGNLKNYLFETLTKLKLGLQNNLKPGPLVPIPLDMNNSLFLIL